MATTRDRHEPDAREAGSEKDSEQSPKKNDLKKNILEWTVFSLSVVLVLGVVGQLVYATITTSDEPPSFRIEWQEVRERDGGYALPIRIHNEGPTTASSVQIEVTSGGETVEFVLGYLPRYSYREGIAFFETHPTNPSARVRAYERP